LSSKSSRSIGVDSSIRPYRVKSRGKITQLNSGEMARTKHSKRGEQSKDGVTKAEHGYPCPRCDKVFDRKYNLTRHTVRKHFITPHGNPASEDQRSHFLTAGTHKPNPVGDEASASPCKIRRIHKDHNNDPASRPIKTSEQRESKKKSAPHTATSMLSATGFDPGELPIKDELARYATPDLPDSELEEWEAAPGSVDIEIGAELRGSDFEREQRGKVAEEPLPETPAIQVNVWGVGSSTTAEQGDPCIRKTSRPLPPAQGKTDRRVKSKVAQLKADLTAITPVAIPRSAPTDYSLEKRPVLTKRVIAKSVWPRRGKTPKRAKDIAEKLRVSYRLTPTEHYQTYKLVCQTKAAYRMMAERLRRECNTFIEKPRQRHEMVESIMDIIHRVEEDSSGVEEQ